MRCLLAFAHPGFIPSSRQALAAGPAPNQDLGASRAGSVRREQRIQTCVSLELDTAESDAVSPSAGIFHLIQTKKISKQEFKQEAQNFRLITRTNEGRERKIPFPHSSSTPYPKQPPDFLLCSGHSKQAVKSQRGRGS